MLSPLLFATVVDVINEKARGVVDELMYADDLVLMSEIMEDLKKKILELEGCTGKQKFEDQPHKKKVIVSKPETKLFKSKIDPCGVCGRRVMTNLMLCTKCGNRAQGRCAKTKRVTAELATRFVCSILLC